MKVGILTYHRSINYGAFLQAYALCSRLNMEPDIDAEIIDYNMESAEQIYSLARWNTLRKIRHYYSYQFRSKLLIAFQRGLLKGEELISKESLCTDKMDSFQKFVKNKYDVIIAGSDEIWKLNSFRKFPTPYWLIGELGCRKFSYAASSRNDFSILNQTDYSILQSALKDFEFISVRDNHTYREIEKTIGNNSILIQSCDPSFLYDFPIKIKKPEQILKSKAKLCPSKKTIVLMLDDRKVYNKIKSQIGKDYNLVAVFRGFIGCINIADLDPFEWLTLISNADMVISSFFHGVCFSIVNNTPFIAIGTKNKRTKLDDLLINSEFEERYIYGDHLNSTNWKEFVNKALFPFDSSKFVTNMRRSFDIFLKKLRND